MLRWDGHFNSAEPITISLIISDVPPSGAPQAFSKQDFSGGISSLMARIVGSPETFVVSNVRSSLLQRFSRKSVVVNVGGKKIGIVGYVSRYWNVSFLGRLEERYRYQFNTRQMSPDDMLQF